MNEKIKSCPFCGASEKERYIILRHIHINEQIGGMFYYVCCKCGAQGGYGKNEFTALKSWNKRTGEK